MAKTTKDSVDPTAPTEGSEAPVRRKRFRFAGPRLRLQVDESLKDKGYFYRFFNDDKGELGQAQRAGYVYVTKTEMGEVEAVGEREVHGGNSDLNSFVSRVVGRDAAGVPMRAYLMKLPMDLYNEDQDYREKHVNALIDEGLRQGRPRGAPGVQNAYGVRSLIEKGE